MDHCIMIRHFTKTYWTVAGSIL